MSCLDRGAWLMLISPRQEETDEYPPHTPRPCHDSVNGLGNARRCRRHFFPRGLKHEYTTTVCIYCGDFGIVAFGSGTLASRLLEEILNKAWTENVDINQWLRYDQEQMVQTTSEFAYDDQTDPSSPSIALGEC